MAEKIINLAQFKELYHEHTKIEEKKERSKTFDEFWNSLTDVEDKGDGTFVKKEPKKEK